MKRPVVDFHPQHFVAIDSERILNEDEIVGCNGKAMVVGATHFVRFHARDDFGAFQGGFGLDVIRSFDGGDSHEIVSGLAAEWRHHVIDTAVRFFVRVGAGID